MKVFLICASAIAGLAQMPPGMMELQKDRDEEGVAIGRLIQPMLMKGATLDQLLNVGDMFLGDDRPHQAAFFYKQALRLDDKHKRATEKLDHVKKHIAALNKKADEYRRKAEADQNAADMCSVAAIEFHQGRSEEALHILDDAIKRLPNDVVQAYGLKSTYVHSAQLEHDLLSRLEKELRLAAFDGRVEEGALLAGRMISIGLGKQRSIDVIREFQALNPEKIDRAAVELLSQMSEITKASAQKGE